MFPTNTNLINPLPWLNSFSPSLCLLKTIWVLIMKARPSVIQACVLSLPNGFSSYLHSSHVSLLFSRLFSLVLYWSSHLKVFIHAVPFPWNSFSVTHSSYLTVLSTFLIHHSWNYLFTIHVSLQVVTKCLVCHQNFSPLPSSAQCSECSLSIYWTNNISVVMANLLIF